MKNSGSALTVFIVCVYLVLFSVQITTAQGEFTKKIEELSDKLTSSTSGKVIDIDANENTVYISLGEKDSVFEGSVFEVVRLGEVMMMGNKPYYKERPIGRIQIIKVRKYMSLAKPIVAFEQIQKGDKVYQENAITPQRPGKSMTGQGTIAVSGIDLKSVFRRLENGGFVPGPYNENNLTQLSEAIKRFQKFANLNITGKLDSLTWSKLQGLYDPLESTVGKSLYKPDLSKTPGVKKVNKIALMEFPHGDNFNDLTNNVYKKLSVYFVQKGFQVVERSQLDRVLQEQKLSYSGLIDISTAQKLGKLLGSGVVLLGDITDMGNNVAIHARMVDVEKGLALTAAEVEIRKTPDIVDMIKKNYQSLGRRIIQVQSDEDGAFFENEMIRIDVFSLTREPQGLVLKLKHLNKTKKAFSLVLADAGTHCYLVDEFGNQHQFKESVLTKWQEFRPETPRMFMITFRDLKGTGKLIFSAKYQGKGYQIYYNFTIKGLRPQ